MRGHFAVLVAGLLCAGPIASFAKGDADASMLAYAKSQASDVQSWDKVAEGYFEGEGRHKEHVKIYVGVSGARIVLSEEKANLRRLEERRAAKDLPKEKELSLDYALLVALTRIENLERVVRSEQGQSGAKVVQSQSTFGTVCDYTTTGQTQFEANTLVFADYPKTRATLGSFGNGTFGPFPPTFPVSVAREIGAGIGTDDPSEVIDYDFSTSVSGPLAVEATTITFPGSCVMRTLQGVSAQCSTGGPFQYYQLIRDQTCSGVLANTPPTES